jgi:hypothetical protein
MKRITRKRRITPEEAARYKAIREQVAEQTIEKARVRLNRFCPKV